MASDDLKEAADYGAGILEGIRTSDLVLLVFSASANRSPYVLREIERAIAYDRPVLSLHVDDTLPNPSIEYYLNLWQWLDVRQGIEGKQQEILVAVRGQLARSAAQATSSDEKPLADARIPGKAELGADEETGKTRRRGRWAWWIAPSQPVMSAAVIAGQSCSARSVRPCGSGTAPPKYLSIMFETRDAQLPMPLASSALKVSTNLAWLKSASFPVSGPCVARNQRSASRL